MSKGASRPILRRNPSDVRRDRRRKETSHSSAAWTEAIKHMHLKGHRCTLTPQDFAELQELVRHRPWRQTW